MGTEKEGGWLSTLLSPNIVLLMMACTGVAAARALMPVAGPAAGDFPLFLIPWMDAIRERGIASISAEFSAYPPPYVYLLNVASLLEPAVGTMAAVKLVNVPFVIATAFGTGGLVSEATGNQDAGKLAAAVTLVVPTLLINAFGWGQADVIFTSFIIGFVLFAMRRQPTIAAAMFGLALSFKLQTMFLSPLLLYLLLSRQMRVRHALVIPLVFLVMMAPAALAGRPWLELLSVYYEQVNLAQELSLNSPNPWWFARELVDYRLGVIIGLAAGVITGMAIVWFSLRHDNSPTSVLLIATVCAAAMPYILPKMASRYFFVADLLAIALAFSRPRLWPAAVLIQAGSLIAYLSYFTMAGTASLAFFPMSFGVLILVAAFAAAASRHSRRSDRDPVAPSRDSARR